MFSRTKSWLPGAIWKPKNPHSLEHLKYLHNVLCKNQTVTEQNRSLLVETLRYISEILIWGDQNDSSVFDFFLEKNMLSFFLRYLRQKYGRFICVQLLQTLNILFENISNETSLYYLLSNNHINSIIVHKFDFSDEEVMAYYISFLKTLSLKLNRHTIHFFYNEHTNDFALYTEAIKFFNHSEGMVRIAVRTITLNVFRVDDKAMLRYIRDRTAAPYFSNLVWFIGNHILDLDMCVRHDSDHRSRGRLADLVAEHLDHLHYLNDILCIGIDALNQVLTDQMLNRLLIPLYVYSLTMRKRLSDVPEDRKHVSSVVSLFLLSQVFLIIQYAPLVQQLAEVIFQGDISLSNFKQGTHRDSPKMQIREFRAPAEPLEKTLENHRPKRRSGAVAGAEGGGGEEEPVQQEGNSTFYPSSETGAEAISSPSTEGALSPSSEAPSVDTELSSPNQNSTDEEKLTSMVKGPDRLKVVHFTLENRPYLEAVFNALECSENDYAALFALCLLYAIGHNEGISQGLLDLALMPTDRSETKQNYNVALVEKLIRIITQACQQGSKVRLATLQLSLKLLKQLVYTEGCSFLQDRHLAGIENSRELSLQVLRNFYKSEEIFLDMFEDEYREIRNRPLNVEYLMMDASILLPPTGTPLTGIDFNKRLPCGEVERARRAIHVFFLIRDLSLTLLGEQETQLPLTKEESCVKINDVLDLNNSDLIACTVVTRESRKQERRFLVIDPLQLILVEPDIKRLGWGVVRFVGFLQDVEVSGDKDDSRLLHISVHKPSSSVHTRATPLLSARFFFDDHIRCMAAKQRLIKGRLKARQQKMATIEALLDIQNQPDAAGNFRSGPIPGRCHPVSGGAEAEQRKSPSPGPQAAPRSKQQRVAAEQKKLLLAKAQRSRGRQDNQNNSRAATSTGGAPAKYEVEVAEEATSAFAFQALNQGSHRQPATPPRSKSGSGASSLGEPHEIPMEDLSQKGKGALERGKPGRPQNRDVQQRQGRSHSCSPRRGSGSRLESSSFSTAAAATKRVRRLSAPQTVSTHAPSHQQQQQQHQQQHHPHLHHGVLRHHSKSNPLPMARTRSSSDSSATDAHLHSSSGSSSGGISPSLRPAEAPPLSLVSGSESAGIPRDSPKLVPPAAAVETPGAVGPESQAAEVKEGKEGGVEGGKEGATAPQEGAPAPQEGAPAPSDSPAKQLTQLAQMVQQHYQFPGEAGAEAKGELQRPDQVEGSK